LLTKIVEGAPLQVDLSGNFMFNDKFSWISLQMVGCCECNGYFQVSEGMYIGYGYDHDTTRLKTTILVPMKYFCVMKYLK
jgi:hypothetical protein